MRPMFRCALAAASFVALLLAGLHAAAGAPDPAPPTLRVDYFHTGNAREERFALDRVVPEPLLWPGDAAQAIDTSNLGRYSFEVIDRATRRVLYARGFASIYGEWETTGEAAEIDRTFADSVRFPRPDGAVQLVVKKRDRRNDFREVWSIVVDPSDMLVDRSAPPPAGKHAEIQDVDSFLKKSSPPELQTCLTAFGSE